jgi:hypothetical protein
MTDEELVAIERAISTPRRPWDGDGLVVPDAVLLDLVAEVRQLRREYRCAECQHNVERADKAERERDEARAQVMQAAKTRVQYQEERDEARAALVALREAAHAVLVEKAKYGPARVALIAALAATPATPKVSR